MSPLGVSEPVALQGGSPRYQLFMLALCIFALLIMIAVLVATFVIAPLTAAE